jgi:hypothetical protein
MAEIGFTKYIFLGIRSASFQGNVLTIGTGVGILLFYDLRAGKYLESSINSSRTVHLKASKGWVVSIYTLQTLKTPDLIITLYCLAFFSVQGFLRFESSHRCQLSCDRGFSDFSQLFQAGIVP